MESRACHKEQQNEPMVCLASELACKETEITAKCPISHEVRSTAGMLALPIPASKQHLSS